MLAERRADVLVDWARRVAAGTGETPAGLLRDLGIDRALVPTFGDVAIEPPPLGARQVHLRGGVPSMATVEVWPAAGSLTLGMLDLRLGERQELPRVHWDSPHQSAYDVRSGPSGRCTVFARTSVAPARRGAGGLGAAANGAEVAVLHSSPRPRCGDPLPTRWIVPSSREGMLDVSHARPALASLSGAASGRLLRGSRSGRSLGTARPRRRREPRPTGSTAQTPSTRCGRNRRAASSGADVPRPDRRALPQAGPGQGPVVRGDDGDRSAPARRERHARAAGQDRDRVALGRGSA